MLYTDEKCINELFQWLLVTVRLQIISIRNIWRIDPAKNDRLTISIATELASRVVGRAINRARSFRPGQNFAAQGQ
jgi:hypothetical protein